MVCDILRRLPAKSVLQVKCVCKHWRSLIRDSHFIDLHFGRSKTRPRLFFANPLRRRDSTTFGITYQGFRRRQVYFLTADLCFARGEASSNKSSAIHTITKQSPFCYNEILAVNGLICFVHCSNRAACIYNISTREATLWIHSVLVGEIKSWDHDADLDNSFGFGFDPSTKDYKVICVSRFSKEVEDDGSYKHHEAWEVLKLGDNAWRRIEEVPPLRLGRYPLSIHVNGTIYWFPSTDNFGLYLLAFDVGTENFRSIQIPKYIHDQILNPHNGSRHFGHLLQVDGCVAVLRFVSAYNVKLFIFDDNFRESSEAGNLDTGDKNWLEDTITVPLSWNSSREPYFHAVVGTDQIILEIHQKKSNGKSSRIYLYACDWKKNKTFKEMEISGFPSSIPVDCFDDSLGIPFTENLLPLKSS